MSEQTNTIIVGGGHPEERVPFYKPKQKGRPDRENFLKDLRLLEERKTSPEWIATKYLYELALIESLIEELKHKLYLADIERLRDICRAIEEAKKQGEQRIIDWVEDTDILTMLPPRQRRGWRALKEG